MECKRVGVEFVILAPDTVNKISRATGISVGELEATMSAAAERNEIVTYTFSIWRTRAEM